MLTLHNHNLGTTALPSRSQNHSGLYYQYLLPQWVRLDKQLLRNTKDYYTVQIHLPPLFTPWLRKILHKKLCLFKEKQGGRWFPASYIQFSSHVTLPSINEELFEMSEGQDVTSKRAPCPSEFEEIKASLMQAVHPTSCEGHPYPDAEVPKGCENSFRKPLPIVLWNNFPWKWETGP